MLTSPIKKAASLRNSAAFSNHTKQKNYTDFSPKKKLPPFGQQIKERLARGNKGIRLYVGRQAAWRVVKNRQKLGYADFMLFPSDSTPHEYIWPVKHAEMVVICLDLSLTTQTCEELAYVLFKWGARLVRLGHVVDDDLVSGVAVYRRERQA